MADITDIMGGFDADAYEEKPEFDNSPLPDGDYYAEIEKAEVKQTANGKGVGCNTTLSILGHVADKSQKGRKLFAWFTLQHENDQAQQIGQREFHALRLAVGKPTAMDTDELIGANLVVRVGLDKKDKERNVVKKYMALDGYDASEATPPKPAAPTQSAAAPAAAATKKNPWD
jgi:hypothetical protein